MSAPKGSREETTMNRAILSATLAGPGLFSRLGLRFLIDASFGKLG